MSHPSSARRWDSLLPGTILSYDTEVNPKLAVVLSDVCHPTTTKEYVKGYLLWETWRAGGLSYTVLLAGEVAYLGPGWEVVSEPT